MACLNISASAVSERLSIRANLVCAISADKTLHTIYKIPAGPKITVKLYNTFHAPKVTGVVINGKAAVPVSPEEPNKFSLSGGTYTVDFIFGEPVNVNFYHFFQTANRDFLISADLSSLDLTKVLSTAEMFKDCTSLEYVRFNNTLRPETVYGMFRNAGLSDISCLEGIDLSRCTNFREVFRGCKNLKADIDLGPLSIGEAADWSLAFAESAIRSFRTGPNFRATDISSMFSQAQSLMGINFEDTPSDWAFNLTFAKNFCDSCISLKDVLFDRRAFSGAGKLYSFYGAFKDCAALSNIDEAIFQGHHAKFLGHMFYRSGLEFIKLEYLINENVISCDAMFESCSKLTNVNANRIRPSYTTNFYKTFSDCSALKEFICKTITEQYENRDNRYFNFDRTFQNCTALETVEMYGLTLGGSKSHTKFIMTFMNCPELRHLSLVSDYTADALEHYIDFDRTFVGADNLHIIDSRLGGKAKVSILDTDGLANYKNIDLILIRYGLSPDWGLLSNRTFAERFLYLVLNGSFKVGVNNFINTSSDFVNNVHSTRIYWPDGTYTDYDRPVSSVDISPEDNHVGEGTVIYTVANSNAFTGLLAFDATNAPDFAKKASVINYIRQDFFSLARLAKNNSVIEELDFYYASYLYALYDVASGASALSKLIFRIRNNLTSSVSGDNLAKAEPGQGGTLSSIKLYAKMHSLNMAFNNRSKLAFIGLYGELQFTDPALFPAPVGLPAKGVFEYNEKYNYDNIIAALPDAWEKRPVNIDKYYE